MEMMKNYCEICGQIKGGVAKNKGINHDKCTAILKNRKKGRVKKKVNYSRTQLNFFSRILDKN